MTGWCWVGQSASDYVCLPSGYVIVIVWDICGYWFGKAVTIWEWLCVSWWWVDLSDCVCLFSGYEIVTVYKGLEVSVIVWLCPCVFQEWCMVVFVWHRPFVPHQVCQCEWGACDSSILTFAEPVKLKQTVALDSDSLNLYLWHWD